MRAVAMSFPCSFGHNEPTQHCGSCGHLYIPLTPPKRDITTEGENTKVVLDGGATRTKSDYRFDLIPACTDLRTALRFGKGAIKHGEGNWQKGNWKFVVSCVGHVRAHLSNMILEGNERDDNVGAMLWNIHAIGWYEENKPEEFRAAMHYLRTGQKPE